MGVNKYKPHVLVVPEDDANRQLANGYALHPGLDGCCIDIRPPSRGWLKVLDEFSAVHVSDLHKYPHRQLVLLIDFDDQVDQRYRRVRGSFSDAVADRVYVLDTRSEPEPLKAALGCSFETIGARLAGDCADGEDQLWNHELLQHNHTELIRLIRNVKPFLFPAA